VLGVDARAWNNACFSDDHEICRPTNHFDVIRTLAHQLDPEIPLGRIEEATRQRQARFDYALTTHVSPNVVNALRKLRDQGYQIALISNASTAEVQAWPESPLRSLFDVSVFSCDVGMKKPDPAIYHYTAEQLGIEAQHCVFVGDGGSDEHHGAHASGMTPLWLTCHLKEETITRRQSMLQDKIVEKFTSLDAVANWLAK
jgi:HAD superfamily hydrolase (TIGR01509 family)